MVKTIPTKNELMEWFQENKLFPQVIDDGRFEFHFIVQRGQVRMSVSRLKGKKSIRIGTQIGLPKEREQLYTPEKRVEFNKRLWELLPSLLVDIIHSQGSGITIYEEVFDDGLTYDRLSTALKRVTIAGACLYQIMRLVVGLDSGGEVSSTDEKSDLSYYA